MRGTDKYSPVGDVGYVEYIASLSPQPTSTIITLGSVFEVFLRTANEYKDRLREIIDVWTVMKLLTRTSLFPLVVGFTLCVHESREFTTSSFDGFQ